MGQLADWKCHKVVKAGKIVDFSRTEPLVVVVEDVNGAPCKVQMPVDAWDRSHPELGDYIVIYADGYRSWSPAAAFEEGYTRITEPQADAA